MRQHENTIEKIKKFIHDCKTLLYCKQPYSSFLTEIGTWLNSASVQATIHSEPENFDDEKYRCNIVSYIETNIFASITIEQFQSYRAEQRAEIVKISSVTKF